MNARIAGIAVVLAFACGCRQSPSTLVTSGYDEQEMNAAIAKAREQTDVFLAELAKPTGSGHAVKVLIQEGEEGEQIWITPVKFRDGIFEGEIGNEPGHLKTVKLGDKWTAKKDEITDWMYMRNGKIQGNFTLRPLLKNMPPEQAAKARAMLEDP